MITLLAALSLLTNGMEVDIVSDGVSDGPYIYSMEWDLGFLNDPTDLPGAVVVLLESFKSALAPEGSIRFNAASSYLNFEAPSEAFENIMSLLTDGLPIEYINAGKDTVIAKLRDKELIRKIKMAPNSTLQAFFKHHFVPGRLKLRIEGFDPTFQHEITAQLAEIPGEPILKTGGIRRPYELYMQALEEAYR